MKEKSNLKETVAVIKYLDCESSREWVSFGVRVEVKKLEKDLIKEIIRWGYPTLKTGMIVNGGAAHLMKLLRGDSLTPFDGSNSFLGVGDGYVAANPIQTGLQGTNFKKAVDVGYPIVWGESGGPASPGEMLFRTTFGSSEANFEWREFGIFNASVGGVMLDRFVQNLGLKNNGVWELSITISVI